MTIRNSILFYKYSKRAILLLIVIIVVLVLPIRFLLPLPPLVWLLIAFVVGFIISNLISPIIIKWLLSKSKYPIILSKCFEYLSIRYKSEFTTENNYNIERFLKENGLNKRIDIHTFSDVYYLKFSDLGLSFKNQSLQWNNIVSWKYKRVLEGRGYVDHVSIEGGEVKKLSLNSYEMRIYSYELLIVIAACASLKR